MQLHTDLTERVVLNTHALDWSASQEAGVLRRLLERDGEEIARATSVVRFAPGSRYRFHGHDGGEELLVLEGSLADEQGRYGPGSYLRNPPGSAHAPFTEEGCVLFVKLRQMVGNGHARLVIGAEEGAWQGPADNVQRRMLFNDEASGECVYLARFAPGGRVPAHTHDGGEELFVLAGELRDEHGTYAAGTWIRQPHGSGHAPHSESGATVYVKRGHLPRP